MNAPNCDVSGLAGLCGGNCPVLLRGECPTYDEMALEIEPATLAQTIASGVAPNGERVSASSPLRRLSSFLRDTLGEAYLPAFLFRHSLPADTSLLVSTPTESCLLHTARHEMGALCAAARVVAVLEGPFILYGRAEDIHSFRLLGAVSTDGNIVLAPAERSLREANRIAPYIEAVLQDFDSARSVRFIR